MMYFEVRRTINSSPETAWAIITDARRLVEGGFGLLMLEGTIMPGAKIKLMSEANPSRAFVLHVSSFDPPGLMVWEGGLPLGLFKGVRKYVIEKTAMGCSFYMREDYSGVLLGLIGRSIPNLTPSFEKFADALKRHAEENN